MAEVFEEKNQKIQALNHETHEYREAQQSRTNEAARLYSRLLSIIQGVRKDAAGARFEELYQRIDRIREELEALRRSATTPRQS